MIERNKETIAKVSLHAGFNAAVRRCRIREGRDGLDPDAHNFELLEKGLGFLCGKRKGREALIELLTGGFPLLVKLNEFFASGSNDYEGFMSRVASLSHPVVQNDK